MIIVMLTMNCRFLSRQLKRLSIKQKFLAIFNRNGVAAVKNAYKPKK